MSGSSSRAGPARLHRARQYHLGVRPGDLPPIVLLPGDPGRAERIARSWEQYRQLEARREYVSYVGMHDGVPRGVVSSGIGGPSAAIAVEELARVGVRTLVRVGSSGPVASFVRGGDLVVTTAAARFEGASRAYAPSGYPAVADPEITRTLTESARSLGHRVHVGITATVDTFHLSQGRPGFAGYRPPGPWLRLPDLRRLRVLNIEMEASTVLTIANLYGLRAGALCAVYPEDAEGRPVAMGDSASIEVANEAVRRLALGRREPATGRRATAKGTAR